MEEITKICTKCKEIKLLIEFGLRKNRNNAPESHCKICSAKRSRVYYKRNPKQCRARNKKFFVKNPNYTKDYYKDNKERINKSSLRSYHKHKEKRCEYSREYYKRNRDKIVKASTEKEYKKRKTVRGALDLRMGNALRSALRGAKFRIPWQNIVGYSVDDLKQHLELLFVDGMNWELFLDGKIHIDHIIPKSNFIYSIPEDEDFKICWSLNNLRPLWAKDNIRKSDLMPDGTRARNLR